MNQGEFDFEQAEHLARVRRGIAQHVKTFCRLHREFHAEELRNYIKERYPTAPASADRILRDLRQSGEVSYFVKDRRASLYVVLGVNGGGE